MIKVTDDIQVKLKIQQVTSTIVQKYLNSIVKL